MANSTLAVCGVIAPVEINATCCIVIVFPLVTGIEAIPPLNNMGICAEPLTVTPVAIQFDPICAVLIVLTTNVRE